ncbi:MAG: molybdopterin-guanine dinucleotide biosynthesis protein A [Maribacter sp.]|jgi:molybdopterin-guanine dinucleotide biosynthesis protein A
MKKHSKHSKIARPDLGQYSRNEWAILGAPCGTIQTFAHQIVKQFKDEYQLAYLDASHNEEDLKTKDSTYILNLEERGNAISILHSNHPSAFKMKGLLNEIDITLINGNHFKANQQIVILNPKKLASLERKLDRLTDVILVINDGVNEIPTFIKEKVKDVPFLELNQINEICIYLKSTINVIPVYGLILNGGKSTRMGIDKSTIHYHGKSQLDYLYELLNERCEKIFVSIADDKNDLADKYPVVKDSFLGLGAYGGILSAFQKNPNAAWLVIAIDMPNINESSLDYLLEKRNTAKLATAFLNPATNFPDPLFTIFEPKSYSTLLHYLSLGYACPRKMLINENVEVIRYEQEDLLLNINTPKEKIAFQNKA